MRHPGRRTSPCTDPSTGPRIGHAAIAAAPARVAFPALVALVLAFLGPAAAARSVLHVPADHATVQQAVDAAADGDVVLIAAGTHPGSVLVDGKAVALVGEQDGAFPPLLIGEFTVRGTAAGQTVLVQGLRLQGVAAEPALTLEDCAGPVRVERCNIVGPDGSIGTGFVGAEPGVTVLGCDGATLALCTIDGGDGADLEDEDLPASPGSGAPAVVTLDSDVIVTNCLLRGGRGGHMLDTDSDPGGRGGDGLLAESSVVLLSGADLAGGPGGFGDCDLFLGGCGPGGAGGHGLHQVGPTTTRARATNFTGGAPGLSGEGDPAAPGLPAQIAGGTLTTWSVAAGRLAVSSPLREGEAGLITVSGPDLPLGLLIALDAEHLQLPANLGALQVAGPFQTWVLGPSPVPGTSLELPFAVPDGLLAGLDALRIHLQAAAGATDGSVWLGSAATLVLLDDGL